MKTITVDTRVKTPVGWVTFDDLLVEHYGKEGARYWRWQHDLAHECFGAAGFWDEDGLPRNGFRHASVRYRHFVRAEALTLWADVADGYCDAADRCGWGCPSG